MVCPKCGYDNPNGQKYCRGCRVDLSQAFRSYQHGYRNEQQEKNRAKEARRQASGYSNNYYGYSNYQNRNYNYNNYPNNYKYYNYNNTSYSTPAAPMPLNGMSVASMVLGIISVALFWVFGISVTLATISLAFGLISLIKGKLARRVNGKSIAGIVCSSISISIYIITYIAVGSLPYFFL